MNLLTSVFSCFSVYFFNKCLQKPCKTFELSHCCVQFILHIKQKRTWWKHANLRHNYAEGTACSHCRTRGWSSHIKCSSGKLLQVPFRVCVLVAQCLTRALIIPWQLHDFPITFNICNEITASLSHNRKRNRMMPYVSLFVLYSW